MNHNSNVAYGPFALWKTPLNSECTAFGYNALKECLVSENSAFGFQALCRLKSAKSCTAVGFCALEYVSDQILADDNTALGHRAAMNTVGNANSAIGSGALLFNETGKENTACGGSASCLNIVGSRNTSVGFHAAYGTLEGDDNTIVGCTAQRAVAPVWRVTAIGAGALTDNGSNDLVAVGFNALRCNQTGVANVALGTEALSSTISGSYCTGLGTGALRNSWGSDNTVVGSMGMSRGNGTGGENTGVGSHVLCHCIAARNTATGHKAMFATTVGHHNVANGYMALCRSVTASKNTVVGAGAGGAIVDGEGNVAVGFQSGPLTDLQNTLCLGTGARAMVSGDLALGSPQHPLSLGKLVGGEGDANVAPTPQMYLTIVVNGERYLLPLYKPPVQ